MKTLFIFIFVLFINNVLTQDLHLNELQVQNLSSDIIKVYVYPVGPVFNANKEYKLRASYPLNHAPYIIGGLVNRNIYNNQSVIFTFDGTTEILKME